MELQHTAPIPNSQYSILRSVKFSGARQCVSSHLRCSSLFVWEWQLHCTGAVRTHTAGGQRECTGSALGDPSHLVLDGALMKKKKGKTSKSTTRNRHVPGTGLKQGKEKKWCIPSQPSPLFSFPNLLLSY